MTLSAPDLAIIRSLWSDVNNLYVNIPALSLVATAEIATTPSTFPTSDITVTNVSANWLDGIESMYAIVRRPSAGNRQIFDGILRRNNQVSTVRLMARQIGDTGTAQFEAQNIQVGDIVSIYHQRIPKSQMSRIDPVTEILYKRYDTAYDTSSNNNRQTMSPKPQPNPGIHRHAVVDPTTGLARVQIVDTGSFTWNGNPLTFLWEGLPVGYSLVTGSLTSSGFTVDLPPSEFQLSLRVEDSVTGQQKRGYRQVYITNGTTHKAFSEQFGVIGIASDKQGRLGRSLRLTIKGNDTEDIFSYLYVGAPVLLTYRHEYSNDGWQTKTRPSAAAGLVENYNGYIRRYEQIGRTADGVDIYDIYVESPLQYYAALPVAAQSIVVNDPPGNWLQVHSNLARVDFWLYYLLEYHAPVVLQTTDFHRGDVSTFKKYAFGSAAGDLLSALRAGAREAGAGTHIGCVSSGAIHIARHPSYENTTWRTAHTTDHTWQTQDVKVPVGEPAINYTHDPIMGVGELEGSAFITGTSIDDDVVVARAGIYAQRQGIAKDTMPSFVALDEDDARYRVGHEEQYRNRPVKTYGFELPPGHDVIEPALMHYQGMGLAALDPASSGLLSRNGIPYEINREWNFTKTGITKRVRASFEPETKGEKAPLRPLNTIGAQVNTTSGCAPIGKSWNYNPADMLNLYTIIYGTQVFEGVEGIDAPGGAIPGYPDIPATTGVPDRIAIVRHDCNVLVQEFKVTYNFRRTGTGGGSAAVSTHIYYYDQSGTYLSSLGSTITAAQDTELTRTLIPGGQICLGFFVVVIGFGSYTAPAPYVNLVKVETFPN